MMGLLVVVELDPFADHSASVLQGFEAVTVDALLLQRPNHPFHQSILLRGVGPDELQLQIIAFDQRHVAATGEDQAVVRAQLKGLPHAPHRTETGDQGLLQRAFCCTRFTAARDMPTQQLPAEAVDH